MASDRGGAHDEVFNAFVGQGIQHLGDSGSRPLPVIGAVTDHLGSFVPIRNGE